MLYNPCMDTNITIPFGDKWLRLSHLPTIEHHLFFQYLLISPSYYQASLIRKKAKNAASRSTLPKDMERVLGVYDLVGDIYLTPFEVWWESTGCNLFYSGEASKTLTLSLDLTDTKQALLEQVKKRLDEAYARRAKSKAPKLSLLNNKVRAFSIFEKMRIIKEKASTFEEDKFFEDESGKLTNWRIAIIANLETKWRKGLTLKSKLTAKNQQAREYLGMLVSKNIAEALVVAENAARGLFPSKEPVASSLSFDFELLAKILCDYDIAEIQFMEECTFEDKPLKFRAYWEILNKKLRAKRKARKKLDELVAAEIEKRAVEEASY